MDHHHDDKCAYAACRAIGAWRRVKEAWPGGHMLSTGLPYVMLDQVGSPGDRMRLLDLFETFTVYARLAMDAEDRMGREEK